MSNINKIIIAIGSLFIVLMFSYMIYNQEKIKSQQTVIQSQVVAQQQLIDGLTRSQSQYATKTDIAKFASDNGVNLQVIQDNLKTLSAQIVAINIATANSKGQNSNNLPTTNVGPKNPNPVGPTVISCTTGGTVTCPNQDPFGYQQARQNLNLNEIFANQNVPIGVVGFSSWQKDPWDIQILPREYNLDTVVGTDSNQRQYFYNKFTIKVDNKTYTIPITNANTKQELPASAFSFWNPRLLMSADVGINTQHVKGEFAPGLNLGIMSYGKFKTTPTFSILEVGVGLGVINKTPEIIVTPFAYNFGNGLLSPLMNNSYVGPSLGINTDGTFTVSAGLRVGF